jgi:hypothetical protein
MTTEKPTVIIHNAETGEVIERAANAEELKQMAKDKAESKAQKDEAEAKATAKAELLTKLGITEDEARLLLS